MDRYNLFQFATNEQSHTAFWAWIFQTTDAGEKLEAPKNVGQSAIRLLDGPTPPGPVEVQTEVSLPTTPRPSLQINFGDGHSLFVELNKDAKFDAAEIERYQSAVDDGDRVAVISTQFDADEADGICEYLALDDIRELLWSRRNDHPLLSDYADWIDERKDTWYTIRGNAFSESPEEIAHALSTLYGQTLVMDAVTDSMTGWTHFDYARRSGDPYTEFRFAEMGADQDALLYRIDEYAVGHHISLKQYLDDKEASAWSDKEERLDHLRTCWDDAADETDHRLDFRPPHNNGSKTREVACLLFQENPPPLVAEDLPSIHQAFTTKLDENDWHLSVDED